MGSTELRVDPLSGLKVAVAPGRAERPGGFPNQKVEATDPDTCPFCEGRESDTPPEVWALRGGDSRPDTPGWRVRAVPNKYPLLAGDASAFAEPESFEQSSAWGAPELFIGSSLAGAHEVIVHSPAHAVTMAELDERQFGDVVAAWRERVAAHAKAVCVQLIVNEGHAAGTSLEHTHAQLYALPLVPIEVARERERFTAFANRQQGACLLCDLLQEEIRLEERVVAFDEHAVVLAPYASRLPYQLQLVPRNHAAHFAEDGAAVAPLLRRALILLREHLGGSPPLNIWLRTAPHDAQQFHWRIEIVPRLTALAGLELGTGLAVNVVAPETVADELGG